MSTAELKVLTTASIRTALSNAAVRGRLDGNAESVMSMLNKDIGETIPMLGSLSGDHVESVLVCVTYGAEEIFVRASVLLGEFLDEFYGRVPEILEFIKNGHYTTMERLKKHLLDLSNKKAIMWNKSDIGAVKLLGILYGRSETIDTSIGEVIGNLLLENASSSRYRTDLFKVFSYAARNNNYKRVFAGSGCMDLCLKLVNQGRSKVEDDNFYYHVLFILWITSFHADVCILLSQNRSFLLDLLAILRQDVKEKILRMAVGILNNILELNIEVSVVLLMNSGLRIVQVLRNRKLRDSELLADLDIICSKMNDSMKLINSFKFTKTLIEEKRLKWLPVFANEGFWKENVSHFEENDFELVVKLREMVEHGEEPQRPIACHILGSFLCYHPLGREYAESFKLKQLFLSILDKKSTATAALQKEALLASQKLMLLNWKRLQIVI